MNKWFTCLFAISIVAMGYTQPCGAIQNLSVPQQTQLNSLFIELDTALAHENLTAIDSLHNIIKTTFSTEGGKPEASESYVNLLSNTNWLNLNDAMLLSRLLVDADSLIYADAWKLAKGMGPPLYQPHSIFLRAAAEIAVGLLKIAHKESDLTRKTLYQSWATRALDSLATMQLPSGAFPFPDLRTYGDPVFTPIIQNYLNALGPDSVLVLVNGWIIDDSGTGEFKFDAGVIGNAYYEAYQYTGNLQYKNIALSVANYMMPLKMNVNYNYNSFVSLALTRGYQLTNDTNYINRALVNLRYGMYPGQLTGGRWVDGHNASSRYHNLMIYNLAPSLPSIPAGHMYQDEMDSMAVRAVHNLITYTNNCGAATGFRWVIGSYLMDSTLFSPSTRTEIKHLIGEYIQQAALYQDFLDVPSMGAYIELLDSVTIGINNLPVSVHNVHVFPNPFQDGVHVVVELSYPTTIKMVLYNHEGKIITETEELEVETGSFHYEMKAPPLPNGIYYLKVETVHEAIIKKLIRQ